MAPLSRAGGELAALVRRALEEDIGAGDWTTTWTVPPDARARAEVIAKAPGVIAGTAVFREVFRQLDAELDVCVERADGDAVEPGDVALKLTGHARAILTGERTALNFLQRLSGVASLTRRFVDAVAGTGAAILDTRKTTPGLRALEKAAVRAGGGANHRSGLFDMVLLKENHIALAGGVGAALDAVRAQNQRRLPVEIEVRTLEEARAAIEAGADRLLLDNMSTEDMRAAVSLGAERGVRFEASGAVTLERAGAIARCGVHFISVGALTHSAPALDLSLLIRSER